MRQQGNQSVKRAVVIGGCGHVGLPLGVALQLAGYSTTLVDISKDAVRNVEQGKFPFLEKDGDMFLREALDRGLTASTDPASCRGADIFVFVTGTPVDEHLNPRISAVLDIFSQYQEYFSDDSLVIMRSTLLPGTMDHLRKRVAEIKRSMKLAYCPERVAQGFGLEEIESLPQIVAAFDKTSFEAAAEVFKSIAPSVIELTPIEAELTKLMTNAWRYLEFAIGNQFYMIAESNNVDFHRIFKAMRYEYPRAAGFKSAGFAAGPCLFKDTMQLAAFYDNHFHLGHSAMLINEGLANFVVEKAKRELGGSLWGKTVGLLGLGFKANSDDIRESLSFRVQKALVFEGAKVIASDPYVSDSKPVSEILAEADTVILCTPHREYKGLIFKQPLIDVWDFYNRSSINVIPGANQGLLERLAPPTKRTANE